MPDREDLLNKMYDDIRELREELDKDSSSGHTQDSPTYVRERGNRRMRRGGRGRRSRDKPDKPSFVKEEEEKQARLGKIEELDDKTDTLERKIDRVDSQLQDHEDRLIKALQRMEQLVEELEESDEEEVDEVEQEETDTTHTCEFCGREFETEEDVKNHYSNCPERFEEIRKGIEEWAEEELPDFSNIDTRERASLIADCIEGGEKVLRGSLLQRVSAFARNVSHQDFTNALEYAKGEGLVDEISEGEDTYYKKPVRSEDRDTDEDSDKDSDEQDSESDVDELFDDDGSFKMGKDTKSPSDYTPMKRQGMINRYISEADVAKTIRDIGTDVFNESFPHAHDSEYNCVYQTLRNIDGIKSEQIDGTNYYYVTLKQLERRKQQMAKERMIGKLGENEYKLRRLAFNKILPAMGEEKEITYSDFTDNYAGDHDTSEEQVWKFVCTSEKFHNALRHDIDPSLTFSLENGGRALGPKDMKLKVRRVD